MDFLPDIKMDWEFPTINFPMFKNFHPFHNEQDFIVLIVFIILLLLLIVSQQNKSDD